MQGFLELFISIKSSTIAVFFPLFHVFHCGNINSYTTNLIPLARWDITYSEWLIGTFKKFMYRGVCMYRKNFWAINTFKKMFYMFQAVPPPIIRSTKPYIQSQVLSNQYCCYRGWDANLWSSFSPTIAAGSSTGLTIPDVVYTVLCYWLWAEEPPETCRSIYRNK
jgi:hypothetical protein